ncbi:redoxin domain-containing protein [Candidatus Neomarinimicrobiota bacterium]
MKQLKYILLIMLISTVYCQNENVFPVTINEKFPDVTFQTQQGEDVRIQDLAGKNIMLIFPRGKVTPIVWCPICHYQYLEMVMAEENEKLRERYNMEIFFVLPYSQDSLQVWVDAIPTSLQSIYNWKYPKDEANINDNVRMWMEYSREFFPYSFEYSAEDFELKLPVLFDPDRKVSEGLQLFREQWGGTTVAQNVPTIFIIDENGKVKFKYFSQYTNDRLDAKYIVKYLENMF